MERRERRQARGEAGGIALERRVQVLDEVDLIDVAASDRLLDGLDRRRIGLVVPGAPPLADRNAPGAGGCSSAGGFGRRAAAAGTARAGRARARVGERGDPVAEEDVGD